MMHLKLSAVLFCAASTAQAACPGDTQFEMNQCAQATYQRADAALNNAWSPAKSYMDGIGKGDILLDAQRKWLAFRDAACLAESAPFEGGSIQPLIHYTCLERLTVTRTQDLTDFRF